jgi:hypothetical protein
MTGEDGSAQLCHVFGELQRTRRKWCEGEHLQRLMSDAQPWTIEFRTQILRAHGLVAGVGEEMAVYQPRASVPCADDPPRDGAAPGSPPWPLGWGYWPSTYIRPGGGDEPWAGPVPPATARVGPLIALPARGLARHGSYPNRTSPDAWRLLSLSVAVDVPVSSHRPCPDAFTASDDQ